MRPEAVHLAIAVVALSILWFRFHVPSVYENARQDFFQLRRELFLLVVDGHISQRDPVFRHTFLLLNVLIRRVEELSFPTFLFELWRKPHRHHRRPLSLERPDSGNEHVVQYFKKFDKKLGAILLKLWLGSSTLLLITIPASIPLLLLALVVVGTSRATATVATSVATVLDRTDEDGPVTSVG